MDIKVHVDGNCGTIVIQNPQRSNAITRRMVSSLTQAFEDFYRDARVRGVVLTGDGTYFSAGTDLHEVHATQQTEDPQQSWFADVTLHRELLTQMLRYPKPIVAAVNGPALGLGLGLVAACDLVVASPNASFGFPEPLRGLTAGMAIPLVAYRIGAARTGHLLYRCPHIDAREACDFGLAQEIVEFDMIWARARQWVDEIAAASHIGLSLSKRILNETVGESLISQLSSAAASTATARTTEHAIEGVAAFVEKRDPVWPS